MKSNLLVFESLSVNSTKDELSVYFSTEKEKYSRSFQLSSPIQNLATEVIENAVFHIGLFCLMDLDQQLVPEKVIIKAGALSAEQIKFYLHARELYARQLFFERGAPLSMLTKEISASGPIRMPFEEKLDRNQLVGSFGGGKESLLYKTILSAGGIEPHWFMKTRKPFAKRLKETARRADLRDFTIVSEDASNLYSNPYKISEKHVREPSRTNTGISIYIFFMALLALDRRMGNICLGNERSASDPYALWDGKIVNHQFDKASDYRKLIGAYIRRYMATDLKLFSIFEGLYEYKLAQMIKTCDPESFRQITSCNYLTDSEGWCQACPKCAWSFAVLTSAFGKEFAVSIVGKDLFEFPNLFESLIDQRLPKPFECIPERPEIWLVLADCISNGATGPALENFSREFLPRISPSLSIYRQKYEKIYENPAIPSFVDDALIQFMNHGSFRKVAARG